MSVRCANKCSAVPRLKIQGSSPYSLIFHYMRNMQECYFLTNFTSKPQFLKKYVLASLPFYSVLETDDQFFYFFALHLVDAFYLCVSNDPDQILSLWLVVMLSIAHVPPSHSVPQFHPRPHDTHAKEHHAEMALCKDSQQTELREPDDHTHGQRSHLTDKRNERMKGT